MAKELNHKPFRPTVLLCGLAAAVCVIVAITHWPGLSAQALSLDDNEYIGGNPLIENPSWASVKQIITEILEPSTVPGSYTPLTMISHMLDYAMGGRLNNLRPFHRTSLILHVANTALVILLVYQLFGSVWPAAMVGLLFGIHPLTVGRVAWVSDRKTVLSAFFALWCLIIYVHYTQKRGWASYSICLLLYVLSLLSKPSGLPLPAVMLLLDYWPLRRLGWRMIWEKVPFFATGAILFIIAYISFNRTAIIVPMREQGIRQTSMILCHNIIFYLYKTFWPMNLTVFYPFPKPLSVSNPKVLASVIGTCVLVLVLLVSWHWTRALVTGWLIFFLAIFPTIGAIGFTDAIAANRFLYLPSIGFLLVLSWILIWFWQSGEVRGRLKLRRNTAFAVVAILAVLEIISTRSYLVYWQDTESHRKYVSKLAPDSAMIHEFAGLALVKEGKDEEAIFHFSEAIRLEPLYHRPYVNFGVMMAKRGDLDEAIAHFVKAIQLKPNNDKAHHNLANALYSKGKIGGAIQHFRESIRLRPNSPKALSRLAWILATSRDAKYRNGTEAVWLAKRACELTNYKEPEILNALAAAYAEIGEYREAVRTIQKAIDLFLSRGNQKRAAEMARLQTLYKTEQPYHTNQ
ncbi:MAG: tetratricopeptide repeat protein [Planctomycetota bacterium]|nr:MAG: tetratricopeptide repeat protein [Planctomycetota bacterium]